MKKLQKSLLALIVASVIAPFLSFANQDDLYITGGGGPIWGLKPAANGVTYQVGQSTIVQTGTTTVTTVTNVGATANHDYNSMKMGGIAFFGVGKYLTEKIRTEVVFVKPWFAKADTKISTNVNGNITNYPGSAVAKINALQVRAYLDLFDICDLCKLYGGAGLGWSQVKAKLATPGLVIPGVSLSGSRNKNNLAWMLGLGVSFDFMHGVKLAAEYSFQDFGHSKHPMNTSGKIDFRGHSLIGKMMFDI
jgi:opacity protein-like surface antigen